MSSAGSRLKKAIKRKRNYATPKSARTLFKRPRIMQMARMVVPVGRGPVPQQTVVTLKFNQAFLNNGTDIDNVFNLNSIFEPYAGVSTHQPLGRDQYATFYNRYRVMRAKVTVHAGYVAGTSAGPLQIVLVADNTNAAITAVTTGIEQRGGTQHLSIGSNNGPVRARRTYYPAQITGVTAATYADERYQALMTATPVERICLHVLTTDLYGNIPSASAVHHSITIEYKVQLFDPNPLAAS